MAVPSKKSGICNIREQAIYSRDTSARLRSLHNTGAPEGRGGRGERARLSFQSLSDSLARLSVYINKLEF